MILKAAGTPYAATRQPLPSRYAPSADSYATPVNFEEPKPVRVKRPRRVHSPSWVSMFRGLTPRRMASSWPLQSRGGWPVMMAVIRSRRVQARAGDGRGVLRSR